MKGIMTKRLTYFDLHWFHNVSYLIRVQIMARSTINCAVGQPRNSSPSHHFCVTLKLVFSWNVVGLFGSRFYMWFVQIASK
jgi:hypothetical protein